MCLKNKGVLCQGQGPQAVDEVATPEGGRQLQGGDVALAIQLGQRGLHVAGGGTEPDLAVRFNVLAGGGINSPALLMRSDAPDPHSRLGKRTFLHLVNFSAGLFDEVINDVSDKHPGREVLLLWSAFRRDGRLPEGELQRFRTHFAPFFAEFTADEHPADEAYLRDIGSERPSPAAQARELWLQTENLWVLWPGFIDALRAAR